MTVRFRPHHFLCALGYVGKGYSDDFTANMTAIVTDGLKSGGDDTLITVMPAADDICGPCPKRRGNLCTQQSKIAALDTAHLDALGLKIGDRLTWAQAKSRIRERVFPGDLSRLCEGCEWLKLGLCEAALEDLHAA